MRGDFDVRTQRVHTEGQRPAPRAFTKRVDLERLDRLLAELREDPRTKVVEGKRDKEALAAFGIKNVVTLNKPLRDIASRGEREVILLTDFDRTGRTLLKKLTELFANEGTGVDLRYRAELREYARINYIEDLKGRHEKMKEESMEECSHGKSLHRYGKVRRVRER